MSISVKESTRFELTCARFCLQKFGGNPLLHKESLWPELTECLNHLEMELVYLYPDLVKLIAFRMAKAPRGSGGWQMRGHLIFRSRDILGLELFVSFLKLRRLFKL